MEGKLRFTRETLTQFHTIEDVAMFATTMMFSIIPTTKVALAVTDGDTLRPVSTIGEQDNLSSHSLKLDQPSINTRTVKTGQTQLVKDTRKDPDYLPGGSNIRMLSEMCVPIIHQGQVLGTINFENRHPGHFSDEDTKTAEAFTNEIAEAIHRVKGKRAPTKELQAVYQVKSRSAMDRYHDILKAVSKGETVLNRILNKTVIPWKPGKDMVNDLVTKGYLTKEKASASRYAYRITEEGLTALKTYDGIIERLGKSSP
ncbi:MAG: GAF domain-containing protein [Candidatus Bathyarchaeota archaeon]